jgi:hypothetical protein
MLGKSFIAGEQQKHPENFFNSIVHKTIDFIKIEIVLFTFLIF